MKPRALLQGLSGAPPLVFVTACLFFGCALMTGDGMVQSAQLFAPGCIDGPFLLEPTHFASKPAENTQLITLQRGRRPQDLADGVLVAVYDVAAVREQLGQPVPVALPAGVTPPGHAMRTVTEPPPLALTLFLNDSCHEQDVALHAISGTMTFSALFDGKSGHHTKQERLIQARFSVQVADPRLLPADGSAAEPGLVSELEGDFSFYYRAGQPAQPFP